MNSIPMTGHSVAIRGWEEALASVRVTITKEDLILGEKLNRERHEHLY